MFGRPGWVCRDGLLPRARHPVLDPGPVRANSVARTAVTRSADRRRGLRTGSRRRRTALTVALAEEFDDVSFQLPLSRGRALLRDALAGLVRPSRSIPEGESPSPTWRVCRRRSGLDASSVIALVIAFTAVRTAIISPPRLESLSSSEAWFGDHWAGLFLRDIFAGLIQVAGAGSAGFWILMRFVSWSVVAGFSTRLGDPGFCRPASRTIGVGWPSDALVALGVAIITGLPRILDGAPSPGGDPRPHPRQHRFGLAPPTVETSANRLRSAGLRPAGCAADPGDVRIIRARRLRHSLLRGHLDSR